ncbi:MAG: HAMP domain-containing protein [Spirochaetales bacterium]|nr:HAMP domain-containing protein [Spirochaetales bacterium]
MVRLFHGSKTSISLLILILIFVLLIALIVVFSQQILVSVATWDIQSNLLIYLVAVAFPLILLGVIVYQIVRMIRERAERRPGSRFKTRLVLFFVLVALLASVPQVLLSINFISSAINFWLEARLGEALRGGLSISLDYYQGMVANLRSFNSSPVMAVMLRDLERNPERLWRNVQSINSHVDFVQVFDADGRQILFRGNPEGRLAELPAPGAQEGAASGMGQAGDLPKEDRERVSVLRNLAVHEVAGTRYRVVVGKLLTQGFDENARRLTESLEIFTQLNRYRQLFRLVLVVFYFFFSLPIILLAIMVSFLLTEEIIQPIVSLEEATRRVAEGDFSFRILSRSADELSLLVSSFNRMVGELSSSREKLRQTEKIAAWQEIAQRMAHEIKNPLTPIKLSAQRLLRRYAAEVRSGADREFSRVLEASVSAIVHEVDNLNDLLVEFREFARLPAPRPEPFALRPLVEEVSAMYDNPASGIRVDASHVPEALHITADRGQIKQVFANLFKNAMAAMPQGGPISVRAGAVQRDGRGYCRIWIRDSGSGIEESISGRIFDPYFTTKRDGTGLGLTIVERIVFDHHGFIRFESQVDAGTTFIIDLPLEGHP